MSGCYFAFDPDRFDYVDDAGTVRQDASADAGADANSEDARVDAGEMDGGPECVPEMCDGLDNDCDGVPDNGAGPSCGSVPRATSVACVLGDCAATMCEVGFHDCDGEFSNGCEQTLGTLDHCSSCGDRCGWDCAPAGCVDALPSADSGEAHSCVITSANKIVCWGANSSGQLGDGSTTRRLSPVQVGGLPAGAPTVVTTGTQHSCAVVSGNAYCWGLNSSGQLGDMSTTSRSSPVMVRGLAAGVVTSISAGDRHTCALTISGSLFCWGENGSGQLGNGSTTDRTSPLTPALSSATAVSAGLDHTCAISSGAVYCWGRNFSGQVGDGTTVGRTSPRLTSLSSGATAVAAGGQHSCALAAGGVYCWGENFNGQVGDGTTTDRTAPTRIGGVMGTATLVAAGDVHSCAANAAGMLWCWGDNSDGRLGDGSTTDRLTPAAVSLGGGDRPAAISAGGGGGGVFGTSCAVTDVGAVLCWGNNGDGQIGDGTMVPRALPTSVLPPP